MSQPNQGLTIDVSASVNVCKYWIIENGQIVEADATRVQALVDAGQTNFHVCPKATPAGPWTTPSALGFIRKAPLPSAPSVVLTPPVATPMPGAPVATKTPPALSELLHSLVKALNSGVYDQYNLVGSLVDADAPFLGSAGYIVYEGCHVNWALQRARRKMQTVEEFTRLNARLGLITFKFGQVIVAPFPEGSPRAFCFLRVTAPPDFDVDLNREMLSGLIKFLDLKRHLVPEPAYPRRWSATGYAARVGSLWDDLAGPPQTSGSEAA